MKNIAVLIAYLLVCGACFAQKTAKITGKIVDEKAAVIPYALVKLLNYPDTSFVKSIQTDFDGFYNFDQVKVGNYILAVNMVGFKSTKSVKFTVAETDVQMPNIKIESVTKNLKEVSITGIKPYVERKVDRTVLNVESSINSSGNSALELLEKAPGVTVDRQNDQIRLNNKPGITVMIDGKTNFLSGTDVTTLLSNMSSDQIATIELITNPSSKYDAAGAAGIINIKLKRNKAFGTNGNLSLNTGQAIQPNFPKDMYRVGLSLTLNNRINKWNVYGTGAFNRKVGFNNINVLRSTLTSNLASSFNQSFARHSKGVAYMGKLGADYYVSDKTVIGVMVDGNKINSDLDNVSQTRIKEMQSGVETNNAVNQLALSDSPVGNLTANFNIKHDFNKEGTNLTFDADYSGFSNEKNDNFDAQYLNNAGNLTKTTALKNFTDAKIDVLAAKTDFTWAINKTVKIEVGLKSSYVVTHNELISEQFLAGAWQNIAGQSNNFIYKENINAAYTNYAKEWKKWQFQLGLRAEYTHSNGNSVTSNKVVDRNYLSLFPTVFVNQTLNKNNSINYSFSRRVDRPNYQQLNPFVFYMDPYALDEGNPYLKPQFTYNLEVGYSYKEASLSFNYADTKDMITQISQQNEVTRVVNVIRKNLGRAQIFSANLYIPVKVTKFWRMQNNVSVFLSKFNDGNLEGAKYQASKVAFNLNTNNSLTLPQNFSVELGFWLNSPRLNGVEETTITQYALNAGIQKSLMNKKLKIRLSMDDIFLTNHWEGKLQYQNVNLNVVNRYMSRRAAFTVNYNFGNQNVKSARNRNTATDDIKGRAGSN
ncbi:TonB-dependent receptor [Pedobacter frigiditerrae]|uniref:TonB-dependent receptor n=1 Tax=Pedobacter frigiditerrae TaxID=2530452 RepID=A0A4V2MJH9_9SPHI|nr:outer membrane beta-barrel family protein [Pedobacter frigiditerrae]TCC94366.1 TonB-dependent receptor [Pedobacter frigiditerrae]